MWSREKSGAQMLWKGQSSRARAWNPIGYGSNPTRQSSPWSVRHMYSTHTHTVPCSTHPLHRWKSLFQPHHLGGSGVCCLQPFTPLQPFSVFWLLILDPQSSSPSTSTVETSSGRYNKIQNKSQRVKKKKSWDHPAALCLINLPPPLTRWLPK